MLDPLSGEFESEQIGSFFSFAKATDEMLLLWRGILDQVRNSRLVIKSKICSIPSGQKMLRQRLQRLKGS